MDPSTTYPIYLYREHCPRPNTYLHLYTQSTDFSRGRLRTDVQDTWVNHIRSIGYLMASLTLNVVPEENLRYDSSLQLITNEQAQKLFPELAIPPQEIMTDVPNILMVSTGIDNQLKELIARCLAVDIADMPTWRNLVLLCEDGFKFRNPSDIEDMPHDREEELREGGDAAFVREFILEADVNTRHSMLGEENRFGEWS
ncbi:uncharacterized protein F4807DRAFT_445224, partial [Annulohypoxylon truncatum]|uniref:uncharacterized protein n=1 Tax=Annulohypoxylon truncatum TaxID=327061 RepID=UPI00200826E2